MLDFEQICRVCMRSDQKLSLIFDENNANDCNRIATMLEECTKFKVYRFDELPQHICSRCLVAVQNAFNLKQNCEKSYNHLINILKNRKNNKYIDDTSSEKLDEIRTQSASAVHPCGHCNRKFTDIEKMLIHFSNVHKGPIVCHFCSKRINCIGYLKTHIAIFHPEFGESSSSTQSTLQSIISRREYKRRHKIITPNENSSVYDKNKFIETNVMSNNMKDKLADTNIEERNILEPIHTVDEKCAEKNIKLTGFEEGRSTGENDGESGTSEDSAIDQIMEQTGLSTYNSSSKFLEENSKTSFLDFYDEKSFTCDWCDKCFNSRDKLIAHRKLEGHEKFWLCPQCGMRFKSSCNLNAHIRRHNGEKPSKCKYCNKGFYNAVEKRNHEKFHTDERSHFCEICGKGFHIKHTLTSHLRMHTGEKPYKCPHCPKAFPRSGDLKLHICIHTGERRLCEYCDASYVDASKLRRHKLQKHGVKEESKTGRVTKFPSPKQQEKQIQIIQEQHN